jgi:hypothetical protein
MGSSVIMAMKYIILIVIVTLMVSDRRIGAIMDFMPEHQEHLLPILPDVDHGRMGKMVMIVLLTLERVVVIFTGTNAGRLVIV